MNTNKGMAKDAEAMASALLADIQSEHGIDLSAIYDNVAIPTEERITLAAHTLCEAVLPDLLDEDEDLEAHLMHILSTNVRPNIVFQEAEFERIRNFSGDDILKFVHGLASTLNQLVAAGKRDDVDRMAAILVSSDLISVGVEPANVAFDQWQQGDDLEVAVAAGIRSIKVISIIVGIIKTLASIISFLGSGVPKQILGLIVNDTDHDLFVKDWEEGMSGKDGADLYMAHGTMQYFPLEMLGIQCNIKKRFVTERILPQSGSKEYMRWVCGGLYHAKKNFGFRGAEGVMSLASAQGSPCFLHQFAVPFSKDNGTNISFRSNRPNPRELPLIFRDMYNERDVRRDVQQGGFRLTAAVNDNRGGKVGLIATISG